MKLRTVLSLLVVAGLLAGCAGSNRLAEHHFEGRSTAVLAAIPPRPAVFTDLAYDARIHPDDPVGSVFRAGTAVAKQREARLAQARLDSALAALDSDVAERIAAETLLGGARYLGYRPVAHPDEADYLLDLRVVDYGLVADSWDAAVQFEMDAELVLLDRRTRQPIWHTHLREAEPIDAAPLGLGATFGNVFTAAALSSLSVEEMTVALERLADYTADRLVGALRRDFYASRTVSVDP